MKKVKSNNAAKALSLASILLSSSLFAVTVATPIGSGVHTSPPANGAPWDNVLNVVGVNGSAVYLGSGWVLTANHVYIDKSPFTVAHDGITYAEDPAHVYELANPAPIPATGTANPDMRLIRLTSTIPLPTIPLGGLQTDDEITMIGWGSGKSWGFNTIEVEPINVFGSGRNSASAWTDYDSATIGEGQGISGDSGGGAFYQDNGTWTLGGIFIGIGSLTMGGQNGTFFSDLDFYTPEINNIIATQGSAIPEPANLAVLGLAIFLRRRRK